jgi:hypothetical protein
MLQRERAVDFIRVGGSHHELCDAREHDEVVRLRL